MLKFLLAVIILCTAFTVNAFGQDTLPKISVKSRDGRVIISWKNTYGAQINNINIQRSSDSVKRFSTIGTILNPMNRENGYLDNKPATANVFYRVFVAFNGGSYVFTRSYRPTVDTSNDLIPFVAETPEMLKAGTPNGFVASKFVFTGRDNNVIINLHNAAAEKYSVKFFDENDNFLFEVHDIKEPYLILEKVNFRHAGWFKFHLLNDNILLEKYKFYIPKEGRNANIGRF